MSWIEINLPWKSDTNFNLVNSDLELYKKSIQTEYIRSILDNISKIEDLYTNSTDQKEIEDSLNKIEELEKIKEYEEYIKNINIKFIELKDAHTPDSFTKRELNKAYTIIRFEGGEELLIGNINLLGGYCDDCPINMNKIITHYKYIK